MFRCLFSWEEAAKRPWRTVISVFLLGFVAAGLDGYFCMGDRTVGWGVALGLGVGPDRIAGLLPQSWWFVALFFCAVVAIGAWIEVRTGQWAVEREIYARALRRLGAMLRPN